MGAQALGKRLAALRQRHGWSLAKTAAAAGISPAYVQKLERGEISSPSPHKLRALAGALEAPYWELMRLAGYATADAEAAELGDPVGELAQALLAEDLSAEELNELSDFLHFRRQQRQHSTS